MKFFTDHTIKVSKYCLCNIKHYFSFKASRKELVFIDPGVYELVRSPEYTYRWKMHRMVRHLPSNTYISIDYPCDMNPAYTDQFIAESVKNNIMYRDVPNYICTIQSHFRGIESFRKEARRLEPIWKHHDKIIGLGNLCRIMHPTPFTDQVSDWVINNVPLGKWVHVYGMPMRLMRKYLPAWEDAGIEVSVDSTKWTRPVRGRGKPSCNKENREQYFLNYIDVMNEFTTVDY